MMQKLVVLGLLASISVSCGSDKKSKAPAPQTEEVEVEKPTTPTKKNEEVKNETKEVEVETPEVETPEVDVDPSFSLYVSVADANCPEGQSLVSYSTFEELASSTLAETIANSSEDFALEGTDHEYANEYLFWYQPQGRDKSILRVVPVDDGVSIDETYEVSPLATGSSTHANLAARNPEQSANLYCQ